MKKSARLFIKGTVQGVFFRQFVKDNADKHDVRGYIRNTEEGKVEVFLEGDKESVEQMIAICKKGPPHSNVRDVEEKEEHFQDFRDFKIMRL